MRLARAGATGGATVGSGVAIVSKVGVAGKAGAVGGGGVVGTTAGVDGSRRGRQWPSAWACTGPELASTGVAI